MTSWSELHSLAVGMFAVARRKWSLWLEPSSLSQIAVIQTPFVLGVEDALSVVWLWLILPLPVIAPWHYSSFHIHFSPADLDQFSPVALSLLALWQFFDLHPEKKKGHCFGQQQNFAWKQYCMFTESLMLPGQKTSYCGTTDRSSINRFFKSRI